MPAYFGQKRIEKVMWGSTEITKVYYGDRLVWINAIPLPTENLVQHIAKPDGLDVYEDPVSGNWYLPDNVEGRKKREILTEKGVNFTNIVDAICDNSLTAPQINAGFKIKFIAAYTGELFRVIDNDAGDGNNRIGVYINDDSARIWLYDDSGTGTIIALFNYDFSDGEPHEVELTINGITSGSVNTAVIDDKHFEYTVPDTVNYNFNKPQFRINSSKGQVFSSGELYFISIKDINDTVLQEYWFERNSFNEGGTQYYDASGNGRHLTMNLNGEALYTIRLNNGKVKLQSNELGFSHGYINRENPESEYELTNVSPTVLRFKNDLSSGTDSWKGEHFFPKNRDEWLRKPIRVRVEGDSFKTGTDNVIYIYGRKVSDNAVDAIFYINCFYNTDTSFDYRLFGEADTTRINNTKPSSPITFMEYGGDARIYYQKDDDQWAYVSVPLPSKTRWKEIYGRCQIRHGGYEETITSVNDVEILFKHQADGQANHLPINVNTGTTDALGEVVPDIQLGKARFDALIKGTGVDIGDTGQFVIYPDLDMMKGNFRLEFTILNYKKDTSVYQYPVIFGDTNNGGSIYFYHSKKTEELRLQRRMGGVPRSDKKVCDDLPDGDYNFVYEHSKNNSRSIMTINGVETFNLGYIGDFNTGDQVTPKIIFGSGASGDQILSKVKYSWYDDPAELAIYYDLDFTEGAGNTVYNKAAGYEDKVVNGVDGRWVTSEKIEPKAMTQGYWRSEPFDGIYYPINVDGDKIFVAPNTKTIDGKVSINRNPFSAPELKIAGIEDTEDIGYEEITDDISRFYGTDGNQIKDIVNYSEFPEPMAGSVGNFDGIINLTHPDLSGVSISSSKGTATPSISGNDINVTSGTLSELALSDGSKYVFSEESGLIVHDLVNGNHLTINLNGSSNGSQWLLGANKDYHHNLKYGYKDYGDGVKVPAKTDGSNTDVNGNPIDNLAEVNKYDEISKALKR
jgi:hypothetical protein